MAVEDGKMPEFTPEFMAKLVEDRKRTFAEMMAGLGARDYATVDIREENGFTARLAIKKAQPGKRGTLIVCAGGGFIFKSWNEALPVAEFFYDKGINVAILDYHVGAGDMGDNMAEKMVTAGEDGIEAVRWLRCHAAEYGVDPEHIAIGGFSAGGMLSAYAATRFDCGDPEAEDPLERTSSRPDAALILYGAFSFTETVPVGPGGMTPPELAKAARIDNVRNIHPDCPPMFVFQTHGDDPRIALNFCYQLACNGVPYEIHTFEDGPHGGALYNGKDETPDVPHTALWAEIASDWLIRRGW